MSDVDVQNYRLLLRKRLEINSHDVDALIHCGVLEFEYFHDSENALLYLEEAAQIEPLNVNAKFWLAMCLFYDNLEYAKAEKLLKEALQLDPKRSDCLSVIARIICENNGSPNEAIKYVQKALTYAPNWPMLKCQLARLFVSLGNIEAAEREVEEAMKMTPLDPKKIQNEVDRYYETVVTGRSWNDKEKDYFYILRYIKEAKLNKL